MTKPHEQEWRLGHNEWHVRDARGYLKALVTTDEQSAGEADDAARLIAAAPDMARALLGHGRFVAKPNGDAEVWHTVECWATKRAICTPGCQRDRAALRKAGVIV